MAKRKREEEKSRENRSEWGRQEKMSVKSITRYSGYSWNNGESGGS